jgi:hypothetical protein
VEWDAAARRQAILAWQDRQLLACWELLNDAAATVLHQFDRTVPDAGWQGGWFDRNGFAAARLDPPMREHLSERLREFLAAAARELESIDEGLSPISSDLTTSRLDLPDTKPASAVTTIGAAPTASEEALPAAAAVSSSWWNVGTYIAGAAEAVSSSVRYVAGVHGGLRDHARNHLRSVWLEEEGEPLTVLRQIEAAIMGAAARAKGTIR